MVIVQYDNGIRPIYAKCINQVKANLPVGVKHDLISHNGVTVRNNDYRAASEVVRLVEAASTPDMMWIDSDVLIKKWPNFEFKKGRPYCSEKWWEAIFYVNDCCEFFQGLLKEYDDKNLCKPCWLRQLFIDHRFEFEMIPEGYFVHLALSSAILAGDTFNNYGGKDYNVYRDKNGELQLDIRF